jgi:arylsulfatase A-like enzyme
MRFLRLLPHLVLALAALRAQSPARPNVVFVLCDDLGVNDLACYGRADHRTPHLDRLAREGTRFTSAYCAQSICSPSRAAILTGKTPARLHLTTYLPGRPDSPAQKLLHPKIELQVPLSEKTLPRHFKDAGYITAALGKWHVGGNGFGPAEHGFDVVFAPPANTTPSATEGSKSEFALTAAAERFLEENRARPFVLYLAHNNPHIPYKATPEHAARHAGAFEPVYAAVIETLDTVVGRLLAKLDALQLAENTLVIFTSDNGGLHVPEGPHARITHNSPFRAGKGYLYEGGLRIPLLVRWPGRVPAGRVVADPVINTDWIPTLIELAGLAAAPGLDGVSLAPLLNGRGPAPRRPFFWHFPHYNNQGGRPGGAVRDGDWKLVEYYDAPDAPELYQLSHDIAETKNLAAAHPDRVRTLRAALARWRDSVRAQANTPNPAFNADRYRELYVDFDPSRFTPAAARDADWSAIQLWRQRMNAAVAQAGKQKAKKEK